MLTDFAAQENALRLATSFHDAFHDLIALRWYDTLDSRVTDLFSDVDVEM